MTEVVPHLTALENAWSNAPSGNRVALARRDSYDFGIGVFHSPGIYEYRPLELSTRSLTEEQIIAGLAAMIHPGVTDGDMPTRCPALNGSTERLTISEAAFRELLVNSEGSLIFGGTLDELINAYRDDRTMQILGLLSHPLIGNRRNRDAIPHEMISDLVSTCLRERLPLQLVLPAFPFKDQNPFRTAGRASYWDVGEVALMIRLHCIALGLNQLHPFDGECLIVSDGRAYAQIFGVRESEAAEYVAGLRGLRNSLNLQRTVHIIDLRAIMEKVDRCFAVEWNGRRIHGLRNIIAHTEDQLEIIARSNPDVAQRLAALAESMMWNMETRSYLPRVDRAMLWRAMNMKCVRLDGPSSELRRELTARSWRVGLKYSAFSIVLSVTRFWYIMFPASIRATVHAKPGQAVVPKLGRGDPWNAVGVIDDSQLGPESVRTLPLWRVPRAAYRPVYLAGSDMPVAMVKRGQLAALVE